MSVAECRNGADPLLHVVVKLQGIEELVCYMKAATVAAQVFNTCKFRARCQEGTLQDASGMDLADDDTELSAANYIFTPAESRGMSSSSAMCKCLVGFRQADQKGLVDKLVSSLTVSSMI